MKTFREWSDWKTCVCWCECVFLFFIILRALHIISSSTGISMSSLHPDGPFSVNHSMTYIGSFLARTPIQSAECYNTARHSFSTSFQSLKSSTKCKYYISAAGDNKCHCFSELICRFNYTNKSLTMWYVPWAHCIRSNRASTLSFHRSLFPHSASLPFSVP